VADGPRRSERELVCAEVVAACVRLVEEQGFEFAP
jgi:hypothetical protein